ncbi:hypothetical protein DITRI_Ditri13aG0084400 [Diplodiscus trichospermus]
MDNKSKVVDVSSFLLFEATGDSEAGCFDPAAMSVTHHAEEEEEEEEEEDAESCSCNGTSEFSPGVRQHNSLEEKAKGGDDHHEDEEDGEVVDQKEVGVYKKCRDDHRQINGVAKEEKASSAVSVDSTETMNEKEKNRLFWEACLASYN